MLNSSVCNIISINVTFYGKIYYFIIILNYFLFYILSSFILIIYLFIFTYILALRIVILSYNRAYLIIIISNITLIDIILNIYG